MISKAIAHFYRTDSTLAFLHSESIRTDLSAAWLPLFFKGVKLLYRHTHLNWRLLALKTKPALLSVIGPSDQMVQSQIRALKKKIYPSNSVFKVQHILISVYVFSGPQTHDLCSANAMQKQHNVNFSSFCYFLRGKQKCFKVQIQSQISWINFSEHTCHKDIKANCVLNIYRPISYDRTSSRESRFWPV